MVQGMGNKREWGGRKGTWLLGHPGKKPGDRPCLLKALLRRTSPARTGLARHSGGSKCHWGRRAWTLTGGWSQSWRRGSSRYPRSGGATKLGLKQGRLRIDTQGVCPAAGGRWYWTGGDGEGGWPPRWAWSGESWQPGGGAGALSACQVSAAAWDQPSPEILIQAGTELVSRLAAPRGQGQEAAKRSGGQWQAQRRGNTA